MLACLDNAGVEPNYYAVFRRFTHYVGGPAVFAARERATRTALKRSERRARRRGVKAGTFIDTTMRRTRWTRAERRRLARRRDARLRRPIVMHVSAEGRR